MSIVSENTKVLILEDDEDARAVIRITLKAYNFVVFEAANGIEGQEGFVLNNPDIIIADLMMPQMSGLEFLKWLKAQNLKDYTPVLILSALGDINDRVQGFEAGADDYLVKPFQPQELKVRLDALLKVKHLICELRQKNEVLEITTEKLVKTQAELLQAERKLVAMQLAATTAHNLGQPLTAALCNYHLLEKELMRREEKSDQLVVGAAKALKEELVKMDNILKKIQKVDCDNTTGYLADVSLLALNQED